MASTFLLAGFCAAPFVGGLADHFGSGTLGAFFGATAAGFLYVWKPGMPFAAAGIAGLLALAGLFVPAIVRLFPDVSSAYQEAAVDEVGESV